MARGCAFPPLPVKHLLFSCLWPSRDHTGLGPLILCALSPAVADLILVRCKSYSHTPSQRHFFSSSALSCHSSDTATSSAALSDTRRGTLRRRSFRRQTIRRSIGPSALGCSFSAYCSSRRLHMRFCLVQVYRAGQVQVFRRPSRLGLIVIVLVSILIILAIISR